jgi:hypothetical protein
MTGTKSMAGFAVAAAVVFGFLVFVSANFVNFPVGDDFRSIFPISIATKAEGLHALSWENVAAQHWSHRIVAVRLFAALQTWLFGSVNLTAFLWTGLVMWIAIFFLVGLKEDWFRFPVVALVVAVVWFQPQAASNCLIAMQAVQNIGVVLLAIGAFALRERNNGPATLLAWICALAAWFTAGNGMLVPVILVLWDLSEHKWRQVAAGVLVAAFGGFLYFRGFVIPESQSYGFDLLQLAGNASVMLGSVFRFGTAPLAVAVIAGCALGLAGLLVFWSSCKERNLFLLAVLFFIFGSVGMASLARMGWGIEYMAQGRYRIYATVLLAIVLAAAVKRFARSPWKAAGLLGFATAFAAASWWQYAPEVVNAGRAATASAMSYHLGQPALFSENDEALAASLQRLEAAVAAGVYSPPGGEQAARLVSESGPELPRSEVEFRYEQGVAGFLIKVPGRYSGQHLLAKDAEGSGMRVAFRPMKRIATSSLLGKKPPSEQTDYLLPLSAAGREAAATIAFFAVAPTGSY